MKGTFQLAEFLLMILLGAGPASAVVGCVLGNSAMGSSCPMGMTAMDADCPMSHAFASDACSQDCCNRTAPIVQVVNAVPVKPKIIAAVPLAAELTISAAKEGRILPEASPFFTANSPPRYILLRVFRI